MTVETVIQDRGRRALEVLSEPGPVTAAEALALAVLNGDIPTPPEQCGDDER